MVSNSVLETLFLVNFSNNSILRSACLLHVGITSFAASSKASEHSSMTSEGKSLISFNVVSLTYPSLEVKSDFKKTIQSYKIIFR